MIPFDAAHWYWIVAGGTNPYSSAAANYIEPADGGYVNWLALGGTPTAIGSEQELWDYLNGRVYKATQPTSYSTDGAKEERLRQQLNGSDVFWVLGFDQENRIRVLEGLLPISEAEFLTHVTTLMK